MSKHFNTFIHPQTIPSSTCQLNKTNIVLSNSSGEHILQSKKQQTCIIYIQSQTDISVTSKVQYKRDRI